MNRIRALREDRDLRQIDVARATGIDQKTLSNYETGKTRPDSEALILLADFFGVTIDYLVGRSMTGRNMPGRGTAGQDARGAASRKEIAARLTRIQKELEAIKGELTDDKTGC